MRDAYPDLIKKDIEKTIIKDSDQQKQELKHQVLGAEQSSPLMVVVDNDKHLSCFFCPECKPTPNQKIIAKSSKLGIKIHNTDCKALKTISLDALLEAHWKEQPINSYHFALKIKYNPRELTIMDFLQSFGQFNIPLLEMAIKNTETGTVIVNFLLQLDNPAKASFLLKDLKKFANSLQIIKKLIS
ncbi:MAG: hypothetical protein Q4B28_02505 [bacterium]|nr:hypothetical protein [bacterium]